MLASTHEPFRWEGSAWRFVSKVNNIVSRLLPAHPGSRLKYIFLRKNWTTPDEGSVVIALGAASWKSLLDAKLLNNDVCQLSHHFRVWKTSNQLLLASLWNKDYQSLEANIQPEQEKPRTTSLWVRACLQLLPWPFWACLWIDLHQELLHLAATRACVCVSVTGA